MAYGLTKGCLPELRSKSGQHPDIKGYQFPEIRKNAKIKHHKNRRNYELNITQLSFNSRGHAKRWHSELTEMPLEDDERQIVESYFDRKNITKNQSYILCRIYSKYAQIR
jgi:hypothetical protein